MKVGKKRRRQQSAAGVARVMVRLRMIAVRFANGIVGKILRHEALRVDGGKANVAEPALVGAPRRVAQHQRQDVDSQVIMARLPDRAADQESAVAAAQVDHQRGAAAEQGRQVEWSMRGKLFEGGPGPVRRIEDFAGKGYAELAFNLPAIFHVSYFSSVPDS